MARIYAVPIVPGHDEWVTTLCWGSCGKGICGAFDLGSVGVPASAIPCREEQCPYLDRESDESIGTVDGDYVYLRKLKKPEDKRRDNGNEED